MKEFQFTEGEGLKQYIEQFSYCCDIVMGSQANILPNVSQERKRIICVYLGLKTLDTDNRDMCSFSNSGNELQKMVTYFSNSISLVQNRILDTWTLDAPTILVKIDTWVKRKRTTQQILFLRGDKESMIKWNICLLNHILQKFLNPDPHLADVQSLICNLMDVLLDELKKLPIFTFFNSLWNSVNINQIAEQERSYLKNFVEVSLVIQVNIKLW